MSLRIPQSERPHVAALITADLQLLDAIRQALPSCQPTLRHRDLATQIAQKVGLSPSPDPARIASILRTLVAFYNVLRDSDGLSAAAAASAAVERIQKDLPEVGKPPSGWPDFQQALEGLLSDENVLGVSAKALSVATDTERHFHRARILTDARPIFGANAKEGPKAFAIIHTLQIAYCSGDGEEHDWFVALDADDLEGLQGAAERALAKGRSLQMLLEKLDNPVLTWKDDSHVE